MLKEEMLILNIEVSEEFDEEKQMFVVETMEIELGHSLVSLSKWEAIWETPLLGDKEKTAEQQISYLVCMCLTPNVPPELFTKLTEDQQNQISTYIDKKHSATWFNNERPQPKSGEAITGELIYYWMDAFQINWEAQHWHLNRLLTLVKVHSVKSDNKPNKISARTRQQQFMAENARRRAELGSKG